MDPEFAELWAWNPKLILETNSKLWKFMYTDYRALWARDGGTRHGLRRRTLLFPAGGGRAAVALLCCVARDGGGRCASAVPLLGHASPATLPAYTTYLTTRGFHLWTKYYVRRLKHPEDLLRLFIDGLSLLHEEGLREWAGGEDVSGGSGDVIEDVAGGTGGNGQMGFLGADKKDAAAAHIGFHFHPEKNLWTVCARSIHSFVWSFLIPLNSDSFSFALTWFLWINKFSDINGNENIIYP